MKYLAKSLETIMKDVKHPNLPLFKSSEFCDVGWFGELKISFQMDAGFISLKDAIIEGKLSMN